MRSVGEIFDDDAARGNNPSSMMISLGGWSESWRTLQRDVVDDIFWLFFLLVLVDL